MKLNVLFIIFISVSSLFLVKTSAYTTRTYNKSEDDLYISPTENAAYFMFPNGDTLLRFYRPLNDSCNEPNLHLRLLHWNGTISTFNVQNFSIPEFNFCRLKEQILSPDYITITNLGFNLNVFYILYY